MMARKATPIQASKSVQALVDQGYETDTELKDLQANDKTIKSKIIGAVKESINDESPSVAVSGNKGEAVVARTQKYDVNPTGAESEIIHEAASKGLLGNAVEAHHKLDVPEGERERAAEILRQAGINASVSTEIKVNPEPYRALKNKSSGSEEEDEAREALDNSVEDKTSYKVSYRQSKNGE